MYSVSTEITFEYALDNVNRFLFARGQDLLSSLMSNSQMSRVMNTQLAGVWAVSDYRVIGIARLYAELSEDPDPVGEFERLVQHVLAFHVPLGDGEDVVVLQFA